MIAWLEGALRQKSLTSIVLDVRGVGYELQISLQTFEALPESGKTVALHVRTVVREDALLLYGFSSPLERSAFDLLVRASRVGPKLAQAILSGLAPVKLLRALRDGETAVLRRAPGVGPKLAERIVVELRDGARELLGQPGVDIGGVGVAASNVDDSREQLLSALTNLGYPRAQAEQVSEAATLEAGEGASIESLIRVALRRLAR